RAILRRARVQPGCHCVGRRVVSLGFRRRSSVDTWNRVDPDNTPFERRLCRRNPGGRFRKGGVAPLRGMAVPISQMWTVASYVLKQRVRGRKRYPLVLMLEPLFRCNLACAGCGKIQYPAQILKKHLTVEQCLAAVEECGTPMVSIPGGEPLMYPEIGPLVKALVARRKYVYLCTNAILLEEKLQAGLFTPSKYLSFSVHMDGLREEHDEAVCRDGVYVQAVAGIKE